MACWDILDCCESDCCAGVVPPSNDISVPGWTPTGDWTNPSGCCWVREFEKTTGKNFFTCVDNLANLNITYNHVRDFYAIKKPKGPVYGPMGSYCPIPAADCCPPNPPWEKMLTYELTSDTDFNLVMRTDWEWGTLTLMYGRLPLSCNGGPVECKYFLAYRVNLAASPLLYAALSGTATETFTRHNDCFAAANGTDTCECTPIACNTIDDLADLHPNCFSGLFFPGTAGEQCFARVKILAGPLSPGTYPVNDKTDCEYVGCLTNIDNCFFDEFCVTNPTDCMKVAPWDIVEDCTTVEVTAGPCNSASVFGCDDPEGCNPSLQLCGSTTTCPTYSRTFCRESISQPVGPDPNPDNCFLLGVNSAVIDCAVVETLDPKTPINYRTCSYNISLPPPAILGCDPTCCWQVDCNQGPSCRYCAPKYEQCDSCNESTWTITVSDTEVPVTPTSMCVAAPTISVVVP